MYASLKISYDYQGEEMAALRNALRLSDLKQEVLKNDFKIALQSEKTRLHKRKTRMSIASMGAGFLIGLLIH